MSIRIGLYDFFAYTVPGIVYLSILGIWINVFGLAAITLAELSRLPITVLLGLIGLGYIIGMLMDTMTYRWMRIFCKDNDDARKTAFTLFKSHHPWLKPEFQPGDARILIRAVKSKSLEVGENIEQHNVSAIMLRNISFALMLYAISFLIFFFLYHFYIWNLILSAAFFIFSIISVKRSDLRRSWYYMGIFEAFAAYFLLEGKLGIHKPPEGIRNLQSGTATPASEYAAAEKKEKNTAMN